MSKQQWAPIVYGRSYHLDFRFITIPDDFTNQEVNWAAQHILATTHQARRLPSNPRWSLFKNHSHCIIGVTCMVRDLIDQVDQGLIEAMTKDNRGRPLYVFVGYVAQLNQRKDLLDLPAYSGTYLESFKILYREVEKVWLVKDYDQDSKKPFLSSYQSLNFATEKSIEHSTIDLFPKLNDQTKYPHKVFLWQSCTKQNSQLWKAAAKCLADTSVCLNTNGKLYSYSPFLNQSVGQLENFTVQERILEAKKSAKNDVLPKSPSFSQLISHRAKEDLDLTLQHAAKVATASQELINNLNNFNDWSSSNKSSIEPQNSQTNEAENFGFKTKKAPPTERKGDWF